MAISKQLDIKFMSRGVQSLSDQELIAIIIDDDGEMSSKITDHFGGSLSQLSTCDISRLRMVAGVGLRRAQRIIVAAELGRRVTIATVSSIDIINNSNDIISMFSARLEPLHHEECWVLYLTTSSKIIEQQCISRGGLQSTTVDHRLVVKRALELLATKIVLIHNHPSGEAIPSIKDTYLTKRVMEAAKLFDIQLLDHVIIAKEGNFSYLDSGLIKP